MGKLTTAGTLQLGIEAARTGLPGVARQHLTTVLKEQPDNIPAMLWLAYLAPNPQDSLRLLNRILTLDPTNEGAKAGIHWARRRLALGSGELGSSLKPQMRPSPQQATLTAPQKTQPARPKSRKGKPKSNVSRLRYAFRTLLVFIIVGLLGAVIGLSMPLFVPAETLAAWLPAPTAPPPLVIEGEATPAQPVEPTSRPQPVVAKNFSSTSDTITLAQPQPDESGKIESALVVQTDPEPSLPIESLQATTNLPVDDADAPPAVAPSLLIGPALPVDPMPVDPAQLAHQPAYPGEKWIEVNVTTQEVTAWEGNVPVLSFISSTGLPNTPTVLGEYNIYWKLEKTLMTGPGYYLPDVPYTMYFYQGYALHGTYWHDNFGQPMSRGCVNLSIDNSKKLFEWASPVIPPGETSVLATADNPGTLVVVHR